jgi:hypothetical protein
VSPHIAIEVLNKFDCGASNAFNWHVALSQWIPSYGRDINVEPGLYEQVMDKARKVLLHGKTSGYRSGFATANHLFDRMDADKDGVLTLDEIARYLTRHTSMQKEQIQVSLVPCIGNDEILVTLGVWRCLVLLIFALTPHPSRERRRWWRRSIRTRVATSPARSLTRGLPRSSLGSCAVAVLRGSGRMMFRFPRNQPNMFLCSLRKTERL